MMAAILYLYPVDEINLISRYGAVKSLIQLDKLGAGVGKQAREGS